MYKCSTAQQSGTNALSTKRVPLLHFSQLCGRSIRTHRMCAPAAHSPVNVHLGQLTDSQCEATGSTFFTTTVLYLTHNPIMHNKLRCDGNQMAIGGSWSVATAGAAAAARSCRLPSRAAASCSSASGAAVALLLLLCPYACPLFTSDASDE